MLVCHIVNNFIATINIIKIFHIKFNENAIKHYYSLHLPDLQELTDSNNRQQPQSHLNLIFMRKT